ncbi:MAG: transcriptional repressor [Oscillospiraceae bacterium]|nr:transcriptional repressor [Oscillospiraceae bacterium]
MTKQRRLVYEIISRAPEHHTAEEIYDIAKEQMPSLARGTVYRNLGILTEEGKIQRLEMPCAPARYDRNSRPHPHLVCQECGQVEDMTMPEGLLDPLTAGLGITGYDLKLFYVCAQCRAQERRTLNESSTGKPENAPRHPQV